MRTFWWQRMETDIIHGGYRVVVDYEVCDDYSQGNPRQYFTGRLEMKYVSA